MSENKHTPGPLSFNGYEIRDAAGRLIAKLSLSWGEVARDEADANGKLFAAAPLLLDLLFVISAGGSPLTFRDALCAWAVRYGIELPECSNSDELKRSAVAASIRKGEAQ